MKLMLSSVALILCLNACSNGSSSNTLAVEQKMSQDPAVKKLAVQCDYEDMVSYKFDDLNDEKAAVFAIDRSEMKDWVEAEVVLREKASDANRLDYVLRLEYNNASTVNIVSTKIFENGDISGAVFAVSKENTKLEKIVDLECKKL